MSNETKDILLKRLKSLAWRVGNFAVLGLLAYIADNLGLLHLSAAELTLATAGLSFLTSEVTKYFNTER